MKTSLTGWYGFCKGSFFERSEVIILKLLHISDLHIGIKLFNRDLKEDQQYIFGEIIKEINEEQPDVIMIAGDIYDKSVPSAEAVQTFNEFLKDIYDASENAHIMIISGNHDSAGRIECFSWLLEKQRVHMVGIPPRKQDEYIKKVTLSDEYGIVNFYLLPFVKPSMVRGLFELDENEPSLSYNESIKRIIEREKIDYSQRNVLISHQFYLPLSENDNIVNQIERAESEIKSVGNVDVVDVRWINDFDYAALGHIHKPMKAGCDYIRYSGTPMAYSVSEAGQKKGIIIAELGEKGNLNIREKILNPLRKVRVIKGTYEEVIKEKTDDYVSVYLTDTRDLEVIDLNETLSECFKNLLEIRRKTIENIDYEIDIEQYDYKDPLELICRFFPDMDEEDRKLMESVVNEAKGV